MSVALATAPKLPARIGKYPVLRELGHGTTSTVYLAYDHFAGREVAIKLTHADRIADPDLARRYRKAFLNEAALAGKLDHPHIAHIHDAVAEENASYIVMEYVAGGTLEQHCGVSRLLPLEQAVEMIFKCALALEFAHTHGVIHRDIKPANVLLAGGTDIKLSDFGSAQIDSFDSTQLSGIGSPAYMSPEQIEELPLSAQTDIYSLGVVVYQLLTGRLPFTAASSSGLVYQILHTVPVPPSVFRKEIPESLDRIVLKAMQRNVGDRYATWQEFSSDLIEAYHHLESPEADNSEAERFDRLRRLTFFRDFGDVEIWETLRVAEWKRIDTGTVVIREGERGECFYILIEGDVEVTRASRPLDILGPGDCFGEMLYFCETDARRSTTITATAEITVLEIASSALRAASSDCQIEFNKAFMRILINRLTWANAKLADS